MTSEPPPRRRDAAAGDAFEAEWRRAGWIVFAVALGVAVRFAYLARDFELDDALIYQRYVRNALAGHGLVYNVGEAWNALTSPLFTGLSIAAAWLVGDVRRGAIVLAALGVVGTVAVFRALLARYLHPVGAAFGALMLASAPYLYGTLRMETPLFVLLIGLCLLLHELDRTFWLGIACALLVLTRSEGIFLVLAMAVRHVRERRRWPQGRDYALPALSVGGVLALNGRLYGQPLPHTLAAKVDQGRSGLWGEGPLFFDVGYQLEWYFGGDRLVLALLGLALLAGLASRRARPLAGVSVLFLSSLGLFYLGLNVPNYGWYYAPFYALGLALAAAGGQSAFERTRQLRARPLALAGMAVLLALAGFLEARLLVVTERTVAATTLPLPYQRIGRWLREHAPAGSSLAAAEVGVLGWYSELHIVDMLGLVTPGNSRLLGERKFAAWLERSSPDFAVVHDPPWPIERAVVEAAEKGRFVRERGMKEPGFQLYRATGHAEQAPIEELLKRWRGPGHETERAAAARAIHLQGLYDPLPIPGTDMLAVHLTADFWTRGTEDAGVAVHNAGPEQRVARLRLACVASAADLPVTVFVDGGHGTVSHTFTEGGFLDVELGTVEPGGYALFVLWTDKAWIASAQDPRRLGVKLFAPQ